MPLSSIGFANSEDFNLSYNGVIKTFANYQKAMKVSYFHGRIIRTLLVQFIETKSANYVPPIVNV